ncbi:protein chiffon [Culicoides brevitarsis]|uniref:protein chiffon n=1 Tax=Culicoides brevitarsis TaxID=469753 RepID=UPI00307B56F6
MVETSSPKPTSKVADNHKANPPYKVKLVKGANPLVHHKFYLDVERHNVANKIENQIKELGGSVEFFLSKDITHFITDKQHPQATVSRTSSQNQSSTTFSPLTSANQTPQTPASLDVQSVSSPSLPTVLESRTNSINNKQISRAEALLLRARQSQLQNSPNTPRNSNTANSSAEKTQSPIQVARAWGRPIWTTEQTLKFLEKVSSALKIYASGGKTASTAQDITGNRILASNANTAAAAAHRHHKSTKVKSLRGDFIKVETLDKRYRPFYQELKKWPKLNLLARLTHSPFESTTELDKTRDSQKSKFKKFSKIDSRTNTTSKFKTVGTIMTRKSRPTQQQETEAGTTTTTTTNNTVASRVSKSGSDKHCGYCEICHVEYDVLKVHLKSEEHLNFAKNDDNFVSLDKLIESGASVQKLLKLSNEVKKETVLNGFIKRANNKNSSYMKNGEHQDCETNGIKNGNSDEEMIEEHEEDPLSLESPRPKRKCMQSPTPTLTKGGGKSKTRDSKDADDTPAAKSIESKIQATRIRGLRWNAPSPDSRPPIKEPPVYKVTQNKTPNCVSKSSTKATNDTNNTGKQVVVKLKRVRQSELNLLNNEAEQFMFPKTPTFSDSDTDDDRQTSEVNRTNNTTIDLASSERDVAKKSSTIKSKNAKSAASQQPPQSSKTSKEIASPSSKRVNKRLEALIEENAKYTHESLGRLRFQEAPIQPQVTVSTATHWLSDDRMGDNSFLKSPGGSTQSRWANFRKKYQAIDEPHKFNFERVPHNEPWYVTFHRQDVGFERAYEYFGNSTYSKLPYELGPLPPGKEDCCKLEELIPPNLKALTGSTKKRGNSCPRMPSIAKVNDRTRSSTAAIIEATKVVDANDDTTNDSIKTKSYLPLKKRKLFLDDVPRKSPREHASTLAILSSLSKEGSSTTSSVCGVNRSGTKRERLPSQLSLEDDDENSNCTMTSQQTIKTEKDNSSVCSITNTNSIKLNKSVNIVKLCKQVDEMLVSGSRTDEDDMFDICLKPFAADKCETKSQDDFVLINSNSDIDISKVMDICSTQELTLKSVASKEKELQRKITYTSKPKLVTSGFRFNKKRRSNRTGWQKIRRKSSQPLKEEEHQTEEKNKNITADNSDSMSDSLDTNIADFVKNDVTAAGAKEDPKTNGILPENDESDEQDETADDDEPPTRRNLKSPTMKPSRSTNNVFCRGIGKYQFEKYPKVNLTQISVSNMKTRSSDLQKRKSVTPKKYTDSQNEALRSPGSSSSPQKFSPRKLRKPRGRWYRER